MNELNDNRYLFYVVTNAKDNPSNKAPWLVEIWGGYVSNPNKFHHDFIDSLRLSDLLFRVLSQTALSCNAVATYQIMKQGARFSLLFIRKDLKFWG